MGYVLREGKSNQVLYNLCAQIAQSVRWKGVESKHFQNQRIKFYFQNTNLLPSKPKSTFRHLKQGIQDFHRKYVLVPADKAANNVVVV